MNSLPSQKRALLLSRDLFFASKVTGTGSQLGLPMDLAGSVEEAPAEMGDYCCVILDLGVPDVSPAEVMAALPQENRPKVVAFGAHVQTTRLEQARAAGCDEVMPRSRFSATLPEILSRILES